MSDRYELENSLLRIEKAAREWHDEHCGCEGEACAIGDALARLDTKRAEISSRRYASGAKKAPEGRPS